MKPRFPSNQLLPAGIDRSLPPLEAWTLANQTIPVTPRIPLEEIHTPSGVIRVGRLTILTGKRTPRDIALQAIETWTHQTSYVELSKMDWTWKPVRSRSEPCPNYMHPVPNTWYTAADGLAPDVDNICSGGVTWFRSPETNMDEEDLSIWFEWLAGAMLATPNAQVIISTNSSDVLHLASFFKEDVKVYRMTPDAVKATSIQGVLEWKEAILTLTMWG